MKSIKIGMGQFQIQSRVNPLDIYSKYGLISDYKYSDMIPYPLTLYSYKADQS
jgi:hypothetical protein